MNKELLEEQIMQKLTNGQLPMGSNIRVYAIKITNMIWPLILSVLDRYGECEFCEGSSDTTPCLPCPIYETKEIISALLGE